MSEQSAKSEIDQFDRAILAVVQQDNVLPQRLIAERVNLSAPAVQRRIRRMERDGVIRANVALVEPAAIGRPLTLLVQVQVESERLELINGLKRRFSEAPEVQQCYYVTGEFDFLLIISVADMAEYEQLSHRLFFNEPNIKRFQTVVAMDRVKTGLQVVV